LYEGYGMTEDSSYSHTSTAEHNAPGYVGVPLAGVQVKLSDEGEVLIKSPGQCIGYYKQPELTAASFTPDGFFRTGDLGERRPDGLLKLTGRAKELFKTAKGKTPRRRRSKTVSTRTRWSNCRWFGVGQPAATMVVLAEHLRPKLAEAAVRAQVEHEFETLLKEVNRPSTRAVP
jgi:long-subunit acyl-CoA synthetase (AMP-forming)